MLSLPFNRCTLSIELLQKEIHFNGSIDECQDSLLQGLLVITSKEPIQLKQLKIELIGSMHVSFNQSHNNYSYNKELIYDNFDWIRELKLTSLKKGESKLPFEFRLGGELPDSLKLNHAKVEYKLRAHLKHHPLYTTTATTPFRIMHLPSPTCSVMSHCLHHPVQVAPSLLFLIQCRNPTLGIKEALILDFDFKFTNDILLDDLSILIKRVVFYKIPKNDGLFVVKRKGYILNLHTLPLTTPANSSSASFNVNTKLINANYENSDLYSLTQTNVEIHHQIKLQLRYKVDHKPREAIFNLPIHILPLNYHDIANGLPQYTSHPLPPAYSSVVPEYKPTIEI